MSRARPGYRAVTIYLTPADETAAAEIAEALGLPPAKRWARRADLTGFTGAVVAALRLAAASARANPRAAKLALGLPGAAAVLPAVRPAPCGRRGVRP